MERYKPAVREDGKLGASVTDPVPKELHSNVKNNLYDTSL